MQKRRRNLLIVAGIVLLITLCVGGAVRYSGLLGQLPPDVGYCCLPPYNAACGGPMAPGACQAAQGIYTPIDGQANEALTICNQVLCNFFGDDDDDPPLPNPNCPNGQPDQGEQCDDGNQINNDGCTNTCRTPICGDAIVHPQLNEQCDILGCAVGSTCQNCQCVGAPPSTCGNGTIEAPEQCDGTTRCAAGNTCTGCMCIPNVPPPLCPNGNQNPVVVYKGTPAGQKGVNPSQVTPPAEMVYDHAETPTFTVPAVPLVYISGPDGGGNYIGDAVDVVAVGGGSHRFHSLVQPPTTSMDQAITAMVPRDLTFLLPAPGTSTKFTGDFVDLGGTQTHTAIELTVLECAITTPTGSSSSSRHSSAAPCGNGTIGAGEACDDGNTANGDGCSSACAIEPGWQCSPQAAGGTGGCSQAAWQQCVNDRMAMGTLYDTAATTCATSMCTCTNATISACTTPLVAQGISNDTALAQCIPQTCF